MHTILSDQDLYTPYLISIHGVIGTLLLRRDDGMVTQSLISISPFRSYSQRCVVESITTIRDEVGAGGLVGGESSDWTKSVIPVAALIFRA
jgi:hypothetical protein